MTTPRCDDTFWIDNFNSLICDWNPLPDGNGLLTGRNLNSLSRLVIYISIILLFILGPWISGIVLAGGLLTLMVLHWVRGSSNTIGDDNADNEESNSTDPDTENTTEGPRLDPVRCEMADVWDKIAVERPGMINPCEDVFAKVPDEPYTNPYFVSASQTLVGGRNPKLSIPPVIPIPAYNLDHWRANQFVTHSHTNEMRRMNDAQSGAAYIHPCNDEECPTLDCCTPFVKPAVAAAFTLPSRNITERIQNMASKKVQTVPMMQQLLLQDKTRNDLRARDRYKIALQNARSGAITTRRNDGRGYNLQ